MPNETDGDSSGKNEGRVVCDERGVFPFRLGSTRCSYYDDQVQAEPCREDGQFGRILRRVDRGVHKFPPNIATKGNDRHAIGFTSVGVPDHTGVIDQPPNSHAHHEGICKPGYIIILGWGRKVSEAVHVVLVRSVV